MSNMHHSDSSACFSSFPPDILCSILPSFHRNLPSLPLGCRQVPSPWRMSLRNSPSQIYPLAHWNLPHPCLASARYSPSNWSPVQDFQIPCPSLLPFMNMPSQELPFFHLQDPFPWNLPQRKPPEQVSPFTSFSKPVPFLTPLTTSPSQKSPSLVRVTAEPVFSPATKLPMYLVPFSSMCLPWPWGLPFCHSPSQHMNSCCLSGEAENILMVPLPCLAPSLNSPRQRYFWGTYSKPKPFFCPSLGRSVSQFPKQNVPLKYHTMFLSGVSWQYTPFLNLRTITFYFIRSRLTPKMEQMDAACCSYYVRLPKVEGGSGGKLGGICSFLVILSLKSSVTDCISQSATLRLKTWMSSKTMGGYLLSASSSFSTSSLSAALKTASLADFCLTLQLDMALAFSSGFFLVELLFISLEASYKWATSWSSICGLHLKQVEASSFFLLAWRDLLVLSGVSCLLTSLPARERLSMVLLSWWWESDQAVCGWGVVSMVRLMMRSVSSSSSSRMRPLSCVISWLRVERQFSRLSNSPTAMLQMFLVRLNRLFCSRIMLSPTRRRSEAGGLTGGSGLGCDRSCMSLFMASVLGLVGRSVRDWALGWSIACWRSSGSAWMLISQRDCGCTFLGLLIFILLLHRARSCLARGGGVGCCLLIGGMWVCEYQ